MATRFVIEGTWSGYTSGQSRLVHRSVHRSSWKHLRAWVEATRSITYTDGTALLLSVRDCKPGERVKQQMHGYTQLIYDCSHYDVTSVEELRVAKEKAKGRAQGAGK